MTRQNLYGIVRKAADMAGLSGKVLINPDTGKQHYVHPHGFRDSLAVDWLEVAGNDVGKQQALQNHLGHKNFSTTLRYNKLTPQAVSATRKEVMEKRRK